MITLRPITADDLEMLREHRNRLDTRCWLGDAREVSAERQQEWFDYRRPPGKAHQIAVLDGVDVGVARAIPMPVQAQGLERWWGVGADVFYAHRGRGLGHKVFHAACCYAKAGGAQKLWLKVFSENRRAVSIYKTAGFKIDSNAQVEVYHRGIELSPAGAVSASVRRSVTRLLAAPLTQHHQL